MLTKKEIGKSLQGVRKSAGFKSARSFAEHMGFNIGTYTNWEQGKQLFSFEQAWEMADELDCTLDELGGRVVPHAVDDPHEAELVERYRTLNGRDKAVLTQLAETLSRDADADGGQQEDFIA